MECNVPHVNQPAYKKKVSCADAIFGTQEVIAKYLKGGSRVYMCLYYAIGLGKTMFMYQPCVVGGKKYSYLCYGMSKGTSSDRRYRNDIDTKLQLRQTSLT